MPLFRALGPHFAMECGPGVDQNAGSSNEHGQIRNWSKVGKRRVELKPAASILVGVVVAALLFPTGGGSGFSDGTAGGECESWSDCILVRYSGENGAVGMGIALAAGVAAALSVALMIRLLLLGDDPKHLSSDGFRGDHG